MRFPPYTVRPPGGGSDASPGVPAAQPHAAGIVYKGAPIHYRPRARILSRMKHDDTRPSVQETTRCPATTPWSLPRPKRRAASWCGKGAGHRDLRGEPRRAWMHGPYFRNRAVPGWTPAQNRTDDAAWPCLKRDAPCPHAPWRCMRMGHLLYNDITKHDTISETTMRLFFCKSDQERTLSSRRLKKDSKRHDARYSQKLLTIHFSLEKHFITKSSLHTLTSETDVLSAAYPLLA